jgi:hypothetical protein
LNSISRLRKVGFVMEHRVSLALKAAAKMPPLTHWPPAGHGFDIMRSEVVDWLIKQPEIRQSIFNYCKRSGVIEYDVESRCWRGVDWREPQ